ncbi:hypothetical protein SCUP234_10969 [Seiridium cupressi]
MQHPALGYPETARFGPHLDAVYSPSAQDGKSPVSCGDGARVYRRALLSRDIRPLGSRCIPSPCAAWRADQCRSSRGRQHCKIEGCSRWRLAGRSLARSLDRHPPSLATVLPRALQTAMQLVISCLDIPSNSFPSVILDMAKPTCRYHALPGQGNSEDSITHGKLARQANRHCAIALARKKEKPNQLATTAIRNTSESTGADHSGLTMLVCRLRLHPCRMPTQQGLVPPRGNSGRPPLQIRPDVTSSNQSCSTMTPQTTLNPRSSST